MLNPKLNGILKEIHEQYPNIDIPAFLQEKLQLPPFKAEELAARIQLQYLQNTTCGPIREHSKMLLQKAELSINSENCALSIGSLSIREFEVFFRWRLEQLGFEGLELKFSGSWEVSYTAIKDGESTAIWAIRAPKSCIVTEAVIALYSEEHIEDCKHKVIMASTYFSEEAKKQAQKEKIELWDPSTVEDKIRQVAKATTQNTQGSISPFRESLLKSLLALEETGNFFIEPRTGGKYDLHLPQVQFPLLTFQAHGETVTRCLLRIKSKQPVSEFEGIVLICYDREGNRQGPGDEEAYTLIQQYLQQFL
jgi:HJR/Mrr/RecB family endonuclease